MNKIFTLVIIVFLQACNSSFLDVKPSKQTIVPVTLEDYGLLLDNENVFGMSGAITLNFIGSDEYYLQDAIYNSLPTQTANLFQKQAYTWEKDIYTGDELRTDWSEAYAAILRCNVVLDGIENMDISAEQLKRYQEIKGSALFMRAYNYYGIAQVYCDAYHKETASQKLGLPLRKSADPTLNIQRSTLEETYTFMISTLQEALSLLPPKRVKMTMVEPTQQAVHALLTRIYMQQGEYELAAKHAKASLNIDNTLLDYADHESGAAVPFPLYGEGNTEILFYNNVGSMLTYAQPRMNVSEEFLDLYLEGDLRKALFFTLYSGAIVFKGTYSGRANLWFSGLARDEVYLNLAESLVRNGDLNESMNYLNSLRSKRIDKDVYQPFETTDQDELLRFILDERKRQLYFRGTHWEDVRRLNKDERFHRPLVRKIGGDTYTLEPNSPRFAWPIPPAAIQNGGYEQNTR